MPERARNCCYFCTYIRDVFVSMYNERQGELYVKRIEKNEKII